jgi:hypothetical protein
MEYFTTIELGVDKGIDGSILQERTPGPGLRVKNRKQRRIEAKIT